MIEYSGIKYGWWRAACMSLYHIPIIRHLLKVPTEDIGKGGPWVCSTAVSKAWRSWAGVDPRPDLADRVTEPSDLTDEKSIFQYQFTIA
jgi:hypothetical protein